MKENKQNYNVSLVDVFNKFFALSLNFLENVRVSGVLIPVIGGGGNCGRYNLWRINSNPRLANS